MRVFIDQIDNGMAKLLLGDDEDISVIVPLEWLPDDVAEGDVLRADFSIDPDSTTDAKSRVRDLFDQLGNNP